MTIYDDLTTDIGRARAKSQKVRVLVIRTGQLPVIEMIQPGLHGLYSICGRPVDVIRIGPYIDLWHNEEGLVNDLPPNRLLPDMQSTQSDVESGHFILYGNLIVARHSDDGNLVSMTPSDCQKWRAIISTWPAPGG